MPICCMRPTSFVEQILLHWDFWERLTHQIVGSSDLAGTPMLAVGYGHELLHPVLLPFLQQPYYSYGTTTRTAGHRCNSTISSGSGGSTTEREAR